ncbi:MAG: hypothetical protein K0B16_09010 [Burkholderiaceae bacterium]|nr:hypothetical protein [Burkholderiaceae bacterium]
MLTGESMPVEKAEGDTVTGATINKNGSLVIEARKVIAAAAMSLWSVSVITNALRLRRVKL